MDKKEDNIFQIIELLNYFFIHSFTKQRKLTGHAFEGQ